MDLIARRDNGRGNIVQNARLEIANLNCRLVRLDENNENGALDSERGSERLKFQLRFTFNLPL